jgi:oligosaccharide repeat unit polymerase
MRIFGFTQQEAFPFLGIVLVMAFLFLIRRSGGRLWIWSPLSVLCVIYFYYLVLGPAQAVISGDTTERLVNMRPFYSSALLGGFISLIFICLGYISNRKRGKKMQQVPNQDKWVSYYGKWITMLGFILFTISTKGNITQLINPLDAQSVPERAGGSFANYLNLSVNFLITGITLLFIHFVRTKKGLLWFAIPFVLALGIYTSIGFRYRLILLLGSVVASYYLTKRIRLSALVATAGVFLLITLMGIINLTRTYNRGLNLESIEQEDSRSFFESGLRESLIFQCTGAAIELVPETYEHVGFQPIISTLLFPIPRAIYPEKASARYLFDFLDHVFGPYGQGAAMMSFGEYYLAFGWPGLIIGSFLIGWFSRRLWNWFLANQRNPFVIAAYACTVMYLYVVISRGYLPQVTMLFFFSVFPVYAVVYLVKKKIPRRKRVRRIIPQVEPAH